jgi:DNA polymerase-3 subunit alpha
MKAAEQSSRNNAIGVQDMFGDINPVAEAPLSIPGSRVRAWTEQQRLAAERETLGLYFSGHPVDEFLPEIEQFTRDRLANLKPERESQHIAGLVVAIRTMKGKRGDTIAMIQLDDRSARFEVSLFGKEYDQFRNLLLKDAILVMDCFVSVDDYSGSMRGRARNVMTLDQARALFARSLDLRLRHDVLAPDFLKVLETILQSHRPLEPVQPVNGEALSEGSATGCPVRIFYERRDCRGCLVLGQQWQVLPGQQLLQRLQEEFGRASVGLCYQS